MPATSAPSVHATAPRRSSGRATSTATRAVTRAPTATRRPSCPPSARRREASISRRRPAAYSARIASLCCRDGGPVGGDGRGAVRNGRAGDARQGRVRTGLAEHGLALLADDEGDEGLRGRRVGAVRGERDRPVDRDRARLGPDDVHRRAVVLGRVGGLGGRHAGVVDALGHAGGDVVGGADLDGAGALQVAVEVHAVVGVSRRTSRARRAPRRPRTGRARPRAVVGAGQVGPGLRRRDVGAVHGHQVEDVGADGVVGAELLGDRVGLGRRPPADQVLVDEGLHGERVAAPEHVGLQAARPHVGRHPCVQLTGGRAEEVDRGAVLALLERRENRLDALVAEAGVQRDRFGCALPASASTSVPPQAARVSRTTTPSAGAPGRPAPAVFPAGGPSGSLVMEITPGGPYGRTRDLSARSGPAWVRPATSCSRRRELRVRVMLPG